MARKTPKMEILVAHDSQIGTSTLKPWYVRIWRKITDRNWLIW